MKKQIIVSTLCITTALCSLSSITWGMDDDNKDNIFLISSKEKQKNLSTSLNSSVLSSSIEEDLKKFTQEIITTLKAEPNVYEQARKQLIDYEDQQHTKDKKLIELRENLLPPEKLLEHYKYSPNSLEFKAPENSQDGRLTSIHRNIKLINELLECYNTYPSNVLLQAKKAYDTFLEEICTLKQEKRIELLTLRARLVLEGGHSYLIPAKMAYNIVSKDIWTKKIETNQEGGQSTVVKIKNVYFKNGASSVNGIKPPYEWAAYSFAHLLLGPNFTPPTGVFYLEDIPFLFLKKEYEGTEEGKKIKQHLNDKVFCSTNSLTPEEYFNTYSGDYAKFNIIMENAYVQASLSSGKTSLLKFFEERKKETLFDLFKYSSPLFREKVPENELCEYHKTEGKIDIKSYSGFFILSLILNFTDAKDDNLRLSEGNKLVSIDNDRVFGNMIVTNQKGEHFIEAKNVLFLMRQELEQPLDTKIHQQILNMDTDAFLLKWLKLCTHQNQQYEILYQNSVLSKDDRHLIRFKSGTLLKLKNRIFHLQKILRKAQSFSHKQILKAFHPLTYQYYETLANLYPNNPHGAQQKLWKGPSFEKLLKNSFQKPPLKKYPFIGEYEAGRTELPQNEAARLIFERKSTPSKETLKLFKNFASPIIEIIKRKEICYGFNEFAILKNISLLKKLNLTNSKLQNEDLLFFKTLKYLEKLNVSNNKHLTEAGLQILFEHPALTEVNFTKNRPLNGETWTKLIESLRSSTIKTLLIEQPINEEVVINPYCEKTLGKIKNEDSKFMLKNICTDSFLNSHKLSLSEKLNQLKDIITSLMEGEINFIVHDPEQQYCIGRLYSKTSLFLRIINFLPNKLNTSFGGSFGSYKPYFPKEDNEKAFKWFERSANNDYPAANYCLGIMYLYGEGKLEKNPSKAKEYFCKAGEKGNALNVRIYTFLYESFYKPSSENK